ncbi:cysteine desulfurase [Candidatus Dependentiae bacterium]|nr:cysteine desulfurase [Candidatus Dependentiae bacterium]
MKFDILKQDFPIFKNNKDLIYLDNAATSQKPQSVINSISHVYEYENAPVHRGVYKLAESITEKYEQSRQIIAQFLNADSNEIVFTQGTTDGINIVAFSWAQQNLKKGDTILLSELEHHSNLLAWQELAKKNSLKIKYLEVDEHGILKIDRLENLLKDNIKLVAISHISNTTGAENNVKLIISKAHQYGAKVLLDAAQSAGHRKIDVKNLNVDFLVFSAHKMLGPNGIGALFIKKNLHDQISPYRFGGGMVFEAGLEKSTYLKMPKGLEAGSLNAPAAIGFAQAIKYLDEKVNFEDLKKHEANLCTKLIEGLSEFKDVKIIGDISELKKEGHIVTFSFKDIHPHDLAAYLDTYNICVRAGHHCAQPLHKKLGLSGSLRVSFYLYNSIKDVETLIDALKKFKEF